MASIFKGVLTYKVAEAFNLWKRKSKAAAESASAATTSSTEVLRLRGQVCDLTAKIHELANEKEAAAALLAERALNRY
jgi:hypothetical protein